MIAPRRVLHASALRYLVCAALAFSGTAFAQSPVASCDMREQANMPLRFTEDLRPVGEAIVNGNTVPVMISTGAAESVVFNKKILDRLGVEVRSSTSTLFPSDLRNPTGGVLVRDIAHAFVDDFSFGLFKRKKASYLVEDFMDDTFAIRAGAGHLLQTDVELALDAGYLKFFSPQGCFREHLAYWDPQAVAVPAMGDVWKRDPRLVFRVRIAGNDVLAILSTGTPHSYLPKATAERLGLNANSPGATREDPLPGHGPSQPVWKVPVAAMSIGALDVKNLDLRVMDLPHEGEILVLGADFLHRYRVYIARSQMQFYFSPIDAPKVLKRGSVKVIPSAPE